MNVIHRFRPLFIFYMVFTISRYLSGQIPVEPVPNAKQIEWYHREVMIFLHFSINTFTGNEWGEGNDNPDLFNPTALDCEQWVRTIKNAGFTCAILTAKHHDGFCLWPSTYTDYDIAASKWKDGKGDVVKEFTDACTRYGIKAGLYLSPWDRHEPSYGTPAYNTFYAQQLSELLTHYGPIYEIWWDGAGDQMSFDFKRWADTISSLQPHCFIFGAKKASPYVDGRWIGNEDGIAGDPCWATIDRGIIDKEDLNLLPVGQKNGSAFVPAECDVSIRPGWYFHASENSRVTSVATLWNKVYFGSVGRNCVLLLNLPPDTRGRIHPTDSTRLDSLGGWIRGTFMENQATDATITSSHQLDAPFSPDALIDSEETTYYISPEGVSTDTILCELPSARTFDCAMLQEKIELGHRITRWSLDAFYGGQWRQITTPKESIGYKRLCTFNEITASKVRLRITEGKSRPAIHTFGLYHSACILEHPTVIRVHRSNGSNPLSSFSPASDHLEQLHQSPYGKPLMELFDCSGRLIMSTRLDNDVVRIPPGAPVSSGLFIVKYHNRDATATRYLINRFK